MLDKNNDGQLSVEELVEGYSFLGRSDVENREKIVMEVNEIMEKVDLDKNGFIDYSEFVCACT